jgi:hypothetical protein
MQVNFNYRGKKYIIYLIFFLVLFSIHYIDLLFKLIIGGYTLVVINFILTTIPLITLDEKYKYSFLKTRILEILKNNVSILTGNKNETLKYLEERIKTNKQTFRTFYYLLLISVYLPFVFITLFANRLHSNNIANIQDFTTFGIFSFLVDGNLSLNQYIDYIKTILTGNDNLFFILLNSLTFSIFLTLMFVRFLKERNKLK